MGQTLATTPQLLLLWSSGQGYQAKGVLELEGCRVPGVGMTLGSGAREVNGEGGREGRCQEPGLGISLWGDPGMPSNVKEAGDLPRLGDWERNLRNSGEGKEAPA